MNIKFILYFYLINDYHFIQIYFSFYNLNNSYFITLFLFPYFCKPNIDFKNKNLKKQYLNLFLINNQLNNISKIPI